MARAELLHVKVLQGNRELTEPVRKSILEKNDAVDTGYCGSGMIRKQKAHTGY